jgi:hypothetical protein
MEKYHVRLRTVKDPEFDLEAHFDMIGGCPMQCM